MTHVSASQISTYRDCPRKWAYSRVRPRSQNRYAAFGDRAHKVAEAWLEHGTPPDASTPEGRCILSGISDLPMPGVADVERKFTETWHGIRFTGRIDFSYRLRYADCPGCEGPNGVVCPRHGQQVVIGDHKTTGRREYIKSAEQLAEDPQRILYAYWAVEALGAEQVLAHWQYYLRDGSHSRSVLLTEDADAIRGRFVALYADSAAPIRLSAGLPIDSFPRKLSACQKYGGCPYRDECLASQNPLDLALSVMRNQPKPEKG